MGTFLMSSRGDIIKVARQGFALPATHALGYNDYYAQTEDPHQFPALLGLAQQNVQGHTARIAAFVAANCARVDRQ